MFSRILVGVDGSEHAARALAVAAELAFAERGRLTLMSVVPHPSPWAWDGPISLDELRRESERYYEAILRKAAETVPARVPTTLLVRHGPAADCLLDEVRRDQYDLIVVGSRERGRLRSALFGGLGQKLERRSPVPVLVVPVPATDVRGSARGPGRELGLLLPIVSIVTGAPLHEAHVCQPTCAARRRGVSPAPPSRRAPRHTQ